MAAEPRRNAKSTKPHEALIGAIREAGRPLKGSEVHAAIRAAGQPGSTWKSWQTSLSGWIALHPQIRVTGSGAAKRYEWGDPTDAKTALDLLAGRPKAPEWLRAAWRDAVAIVLSGPGDAINPTLRAAKERQGKMDVARAVAELAIEVEEIAHNGADSEQIVKRVRNSAAQRDLTPIGVAGEDTRFDPAVHKLQFGNPKPGIPVFVMKPGYAWRYGDDTVVIEHALVATA